MDPFSHAALGRTLAAFAPEACAGRTVAAAATLGALAPDLDAALMPIGWDIYLRVHEVGTHTAIGTAACGLLTGSVIRLFARRVPLWTLAGAAWVGAMSHVLLDLVSSARIRVLWPFDDRTVSLPLVAMADPWLAALLIAGVSATMLARARARLATTIAIALCVMFLAAKAVLATRAVAAYRESAGPLVAARDSMVEARWARLTEWHVFDRADGRLRHWLAAGAPRESRLLLSWPATVDGPNITTSRTLSVVRNFLQVHHLAFAARVPRPGEREWVLWSDIRFCWNPDVAGAPRVEPIVNDGGARLACAVWFGAEFDRQGTPLLQIVQVGRFIQTRGVTE